MLKFRKYKSKDKKELQKMVADYYKEDPPTLGDKCKMDLGKTILQLQKHPDKGNFWIFEKNKNIAGYSLTINYWSNEWGGNYIIIDELYVKPEWRNQKIASNFFEKLGGIKGTVGLHLEVHPHNKKMVSFYEKLGFKMAKNLFMEKFLG